MLEVTAEPAFVAARVVAAISPSGVGWAASVGSLVGVATESVSGVDSDAPQHGCDFLVEQAADLVHFSYAQAGEDGAGAID
jgi:hypothetical protein